MFKKMFLFLMSTFSNLKFLYLLGINKCVKVNFDI